jgi:hypothetical protein
MRVTVEFVNQGYDTYSQQKFENIDRVDFELSDTYVSGDETILMLNPTTVRWLKLEQEDD